LKAKAGAALRQASAAAARVCLAFMAVLSNQRVW
jgi:hypothetical protein